MNLKEFFRYTSAIALLLLLLSGVTRANAVRFADINVKGKVTDTTGAALPGVTVQVKGTRTGTVTNADGNYAITVPEKGVLTFSLIGYKTLEIAANGSVLNVKLQADSRLLAEVGIVSIGYGTVRRNDLTGAINSVSAANFNKGVISSTEQLFQGKVAGLTITRSGGDPVNGSALRLRGGTSLSAGNAPLIVVDGIAGVDMNTISPNDIASVDVLKDASAAAIYGARAANGVIIINTKRNKDNTTTVDYNGYAALSYAANFIDMLSADQWRKYVRDSSKAGAVDYGASTDWQQEILRTGFSQSHSLSLSGGNDKTYYRASVNYLKNQGIVITSNLDRLNGKFSLEQKAINDKLKISLSLSNTFDEFTPIDYTALRFAYNLNPTIPVYAPDGSFFEDRGTLDYFNPVGVLRQRTNDQTRSRFLGVTKFDYEILTGLKAIMNLSYVKNDFKNKFYLPNNSAYGLQDKGRAQQDQNTLKEKQLEFYLNYDKKFDDHALNVVAGYSYLESNNAGAGAVRRGYDTNIFGPDNMGAGQDYRAGDVYSFRSKWNLISFFGRANYSYKGKYLISATLRRDGSSKFGANNKWGLFPSGAIGWNISDEAFMEGSKNWLDRLKIRVGYGVTGNQEGIAPYQSLALSGPVAGEQYYDAISGQWKTAYGPIQNPNPDLKWESTAQLNLGLDFRLFKRLNGSIDYYRKKTSDLLFTYAVPQPPYLYGTMLANVGDLENKGVELTLSSPIIATKDFTWNIDFNMAYNTQKITRLSNDIYTTDAILGGYLPNRGFSNVYSQVIKEGYAPGTFFGLKSLGLDDKGQYIFQDLDGNGVIDDNDKQILGNAQPKYTAGLGMSFGYKNFDLSFSMYGMFGQKVLNATLMSISDDTRLPTNNVPDAALTDGLKATPVFSSYWIEKGDFVRLQNLTLGYKLPFKYTSWMRNARIFVTGENLFVITKYKGQDPEVSSEGLATPGIDNFITTGAGTNTGSYYRPRTFSFGASLSF